MKIEEKSLEKLKNEHNKWKLEFPYETQDDLLKHGKNVGKPVLDYYVHLFQENHGDNYYMRQATNGCKMFDPMFLKGKEDEIHALLYLINDLSFFKYTVFNEGFLSK